MQLDGVVELTGLKLPYCSCVESWNIESVASQSTHRAQDMVEVPNLVKNSPIVAASEVRDCTSL